MRSLSKRALVLACTCALLIPGAAHAASPYGTAPSCTSGTLMSAQAWDITPPVMMGGRHIHTDVCLPFLKTLSAPADIDVRSLLHNSDSTARFVRWSDGSNVKQSVAVNWHPGPVMEASRYDTLHLDPALFDADGWRELRITTDANDPVKGRWYTTSRYCVFVQGSGKARSDYCGGPTTSGRCGWAGWYGDYFNVYVDCRDYNRVLTGPLHAGDTLRVKFQDARGVATIDPDFHHDNPGQVIYDGAGNDTWRTITIPAGLAPGPHKLHLRTEQTRTSSPAGTFAGAGVLTFTAG
ncbi:MAG: hypothetical protein ACXVFK_01480 [Solirubrobacteraceae bacterium]